MVLSRTWPTSRTMGSVAWAGQSAPGLRVGHAAEPSLRRRGPTSEEQAPTPSEADEPVLDWYGLPSPALLRAVLGVGRGGRRRLGGLHPGRVPVRGHAAGLRWAAVRSRRRRGRRGHRAAADVARRHRGRRLRRRWPAVGRLDLVGGVRGAPERRLVAAALGGAARSCAWAWRRARAAASEAPPRKSATAPRWRSRRTRRRPRRRRSRRTRRPRRRRRRGARSPAPRRRCRTPRRTARPRLR